MLQENKTTLRGFTLIELLMVFGVIAVLAAITFGVTTGVRNAQNRSKATGELVTIAIALEQFKATYGDYPWLDSAEEGETLIYALTGRARFDPRAPDGPMVRVGDQLDDPDVELARRFIDIDKFAYSGPANAPEALLDPWGNPYIYLYKSADSPEAWDLFGFHLYSTGPEGEAADAEVRGSMNESTGVLSENFRAIADAAGIIFAGE